MENFDLEIVVAYKNYVPKMPFCVLMLRGFLMKRVTKVSRK